MSDPIDDERALKLERALAEEQRQERAQQSVDLDRQARTDAGIADAIARSVGSSSDPAG